MSVRGENETTPSPPSNSSSETQRPSPLSISGIMILKDIVAHHYWGRFKSKSSSPCINQWGKVQSLKHTFTLLLYTGKFLLPTHILSSRLGKLRTYQPNSTFSLKILDLHSYHQDLQLYPYLPSGGTKTTMRKTLVQVIVHCGHVNMDFWDLRSLVHAESPGKFTS